MNIATLLMAADYLERKDREAEHGYAANLPMPAVLPSTRRKTKVRKIQAGRNSHNELEKNRRAHLRNCLDSLKKVVPFSEDNTRHTTLGLLIDAKTLVKNLERKETDQKALREELKEEQKYLLWCLEQSNGSQYRARVGHSLSECSTTSTTSSNSNSSEPDDVDVTSGLSDESDDVSSSSIDVVSPFNRVNL